MCKSLLTVQIASKRTEGLGKMKSTFLIVALGAIAIAAPASAATNLLTNGGFENQTFPGTTTYYNVGPSGSGANHPIPPGFGWTVPTNNVDIISYASYGPAPAGGGDYGLDLVGYGSTGEISQTLNTVMGRVYNVSFQYSANPGFTDPMADVLVNNAAIGSVTGLSSWQTFTGSFIGTGSPETFALNETAGGGNAGVFLDNISISAVPEPFTWLLMIGGVAMIGAGLRFNRRGAVALTA